MRTWEGKGGGMWPGPVIPEACSAHTVGTEARGLSPGLVDGWKEHLPVFTVKKKFKKHVKPQVHGFSTSLESWLQLTPHVRRQVAAKETRCKQWLTCSRPSTMLGGNLTVEEREDVEA